MQRILPVTIVLLCLLVISSVASAQTNQATQTVTFTVNAIQRISVNGDPGLLQITDVTAGTTNYVPVSDNSTNYSITTNVANARITAGLSANMPTGLTLEIALASTRGTTSGTVDISNTAGAGNAVEVVTAIGLGADANQGITYTLSGTTDSGTWTNATRTVTLTLTTP